MPWILIFFAGLLEIAWAASIKQSDGFTRLWPTVAMLVTMTGSITLLALAMRRQARPITRWARSPRTRRTVLTAPSTSARTADTAWVAMSSVHGSSATPCRLSDG